MVIRLSIIGATTVLVACLGARGDHPAGMGAKTASATASTVVASEPSARADSAVLFRTELRPILSRKCAPCHEPGGKMYSRLPFDDPRTISSHAEGVAKRLKGEDSQALERFLAALPPSRSD